MLKRIKKLDYSEKKYSNPFFRVKRRKFVPKISSFGFGVWVGRVKLAIFSFLAFVGAVIWFFYFSPLFNITSISVNGNTKTPVSGIEEIVRNQMADKAFLIFKQSNLNVFNKGKLVKALVEKYYFDNLSVDKKWFHTLAINLTEKDYSLVWREGDRYYYLDNTGKVLSEVQPLEIKEKIYPLIENRGETLISEGKASVDEKTLVYIVAFFEEFRTSHKDFQIERFILDSEANTVKVGFLGGPIVYFNTGSDMKEQIDRLFALINEKLKDNFFNKSYIDLRYGDRVYYR